LSLTYGKNEIIIQIIPHCQNSSEIHSKIIERGGLSGLGTGTSIIIVQL
jgi:hypothetical protein